MTYDDRRDEVEDRIGEDLFMLNFASEEDQQKAMKILDAADHDLGEIEERTGVLDSEEEIVRLEAVADALDPLTEGPDTSGW